MRFLALITVGAALTAGAAHAVTYGDVDNNGTITMGDVRGILQIAAGLATAGSNAYHAADVAPVNNYEAGSFGDGVITVADVIRVAQKVNDQSTAEWPAKPSFYQLEIGNTFTYHKYDSTGAYTGDTTQTITSTTTDTLTSGSYPVYVITGSDGKEQHIGNSTSPQGAKQIILTKGTISGTLTNFDPPLVVLQAPVQAGTTWSGSTSTTISGYPTTPTYTGTIALEPTLSVPYGASTMTFTNVYKVTINYQGTVTIYGFPASYTGTEVYWFVPFLGPVQHSYTRTDPTGTTSANPDLSLAAANIHGVKYP